MEEVCTSHKRSQQELEASYGSVGDFLLPLQLCRKHSSLGKQTPAMAAGLANSPLKLVELLN